MDERTLTALQDSIWKWERIVANGGFSTGEVCALCRMFILNGCHGCPVFAMTGQAGCGGSPFAEWAEATDSADELASAKAELDFLRSLLPPSETK